MTRPAYGQDAILREAVEIRANRRNARDGALFRESVAAASLATDLHTAEAGICLRQLSMLARTGDAHRFSCTCGWEGQIAGVAAAAAAEVP